MGTWQAFQGALAEDDAAQFCAELGMNASAARQAVRTLARAAGFAPETLMEWCSADAPGAPEDVPALYYAVLLPENSTDDMPLGLGDSPAAALVDLLWALGGPLLLLQLSAYDPEPLPDATAEGDTPRTLTEAR